MRRDLYGQLLSNVLSRPSAGNSIPKRTNIGGQEHLLAYITPEESFTLRSKGGGVPPGGGQYMVNGVPAFFESFGDIGNPQAQAEAMADVEADIASQAQAQALADIDAQIHQQQIQNQAVQQAVQMANIENQIADAAVAKAAGQLDPGLNPESGAIMETPPFDDTVVTPVHSFWSDKAKSRRKSGANLAAVTNRLSAARPTKTAAYYTGVNMPSGDVVPDPVTRGPDAVLAPPADNLNIPSIVAPISPISLAPGESYTSYDDDPAALSLSDDIGLYAGGIGSKPGSFDDNIGLYAGDLATYYTGVNMPGDVVPFEDESYDDNIGLYAGKIGSKPGTTMEAEAEVKAAGKRAVEAVKQGKGFYATATELANMLAETLDITKEDAQNQALDTLQDALGKTFFGFYPAFGSNLAEMAFRSGLSVDDATMATDAEGMGPSDQEMAQYILAQKPQGSTDAQEDAQEVQRVFSEVPPDIAARLDRNIRGVPSGENENRLALLRTLLNQRNLLG